MQKDIAKYDYIIVGAGITGATIANILSSKSKKKVLVLEKRSHIAGNCYTESSNNIDVHMYGAHIFRTSKKMIWDYVNSFHPFHFFTHKVIVNFNGKKYSFPINLMTLNQITDGEIDTPTKAQKYFETIGKPEWVGSSDLETHCIGMIGPDLFNVFVRGYTEKQWGKKCSELPSSIIKRIPVRTTWNDNYFADSKVYQGIPEAGGYTTLVENMLSDIEVLTECDFLKDKEFWESRTEHIIYTGPIDELLYNKYGPLPWRSLQFKTVYKPIEDFQGVPVMNYTSADIPFTRIIEHKHFCPANKTPGTVITEEYPQDWKPGLEKYYPMQDTAALKLLEMYEHDILDMPQYTVAGRLGKYKYYDMDVAIENAMKVAFNLLQPK